MKLKILPKKKSDYFILIVIGIGVCVDVFRDFMIGSSGGVSENIKLTYEFVGIAKIFIILKNIYESVLISHGGIFANAIVSPVRSVKFFLLF
jgi:hypothetical protein